MLQGIKGAFAVSPNGEDIRSRKILGFRSKRSKKISQGLSALLGLLGFGFVLGGGLFLFFSSCLPFGAICILCVYFGVPFSSTYSRIACLSIEKKNYVISIKKWGDVF